MGNKHAIIGTWTKQDGTKEWDLFLGPVTLEEANDALPNIVKKIPVTDFLLHDEFIVTWEIYKLMSKTLNVYE